MISYIKGKVAEVLEDRVVVENNNMGYNILVPASLITSLPSVGNEVKLHTYLYVREDAINLYGFLTKDDLYIFKLLLLVNGIGPKVALGILGAITPDDLRIAVITDDVKTISKSPGIGSKTAQKLIIELKDKLKLEDAFAPKEDSKALPNPINEIKSEAIQALSALGYSDTQAYRAVNQAYTGEIESSQELIKSALRKLVSM
jgi:Holliday junction DNA helicase RuvA